MTYLRSGFTIDSNVHDNGLLSLVESSWHLLADGPKVFIAWNPILLHNWDLGGGRRNQCIKGPGECATGSYNWIVHGRRKLECNLLEKFIRINEMGRRGGVFVERCHCGSARGKIRLLNLLLYCWMEPRKISPFVLVLDSHSIAKKSIRETWILLSRGSHPINLFLFATSIKSV